MKVYNNPHENLTQQLQETLEVFRQMRNFNPSQYATQKAASLNSYMSKSGLNACVVAVSGGIDSALVLSLVSYASKQIDSPIKKIVAITLPNFDSHAATNQNETIQKSKDLSFSLNTEIHTINTTDAHKSILTSVTNKLGQSDDWASGQLTAYTRTPFLYFATSVLSSQGFNPVLIGTTNRDEGAYLGYVGKASDGMVDIQLISDLHKSEVYNVSKYLSVPLSIIQATPSGDMYDGRTDEEVFGAPYDFIELYLNYLNSSKPFWENLTKEWNTVTWEQFKNYQLAVEKLHKYNQHKYLIGSPAVHLDVLQSSVKGGWIEHIHSTPHKFIDNKIVLSHKFVGFTDYQPKIESKHLPTTIKNNDILHVQSILNDSEVNDILQHYIKNYGNLIKTDYNGKPDPTSNGSLRLSFYSEDFAKILFERLLYSAPSLASNINTNENPINADTDNCPIWKPIGINPMFRIISYPKDGYLVPHYDGSFVPNNIQRSLKTFIVGIQNATSGGETQFLNDKQEILEHSLKNLSDLPDLIDDIKQSEILMPGNALIFDHTTLHQGNTIHNGLKIILRSEIMYEKCILK